MSQGLAVADQIPPQSINNTSVNSTGLLMSKVKRAFYLVQAGSLGSAGTLTGVLQSCALSNFASGVHNVSTSNLTTAFTNNTVSTIEVRSDQIQAQNPGDIAVRLNLTGGGNAITVGAIGLGGESIQKPASLQANLNNTVLLQQVVVST